MSPVCPLLVLRCPLLVHHKFPMLRQLIFDGHLRAVTFLVNKLVNGALSKSPYRKDETKILHRFFED